MCLPTYAIRRRRKQARLLARLRACSRTSHPRCQGLMSICNFSQAGRDSRTRCKRSTAALTTFVTKPRRLSSFLGLSLLLLLGRPGPTRPLFLPGRTVSSTHARTETHVSDACDVGEHSKHASSVTTAASAIKSAIQSFEKEARLAEAAETASNGARLKQLFEALPHLHRAPQLSPNVLALPQPRNPRFYGRTTELGLLFEALAPSAQDQRSCVVHGMAGAGKSQLALEFCFLHRADFRFVFWLPSQDEPQLQVSYAKIITLATESSPCDLSTDAEASRRWLCNSRWRSRIAGLLGGAMEG